MSEAIPTTFATVATPKQPLPLCDGSSLTHANLAYKTYGTLSPKRDNAVLLFHALTGSQHAAGYDPLGPGNEAAILWKEDNYIGWWDAFIGPGRALDTRQYYIICANYLGSCYGSTGPNSLNPETGMPYGSRFPWVTVRDVVKANARLLDQLGIDQVRAVVGGSVGGFCACEFALCYPHRVHAVIPIASGFRTPNHTKVLNFQQIYAIESDPNFRGGDFYDDEGVGPRRGLTMARMIGHMTFVSLKRMEGRAEARVVQPEGELASYRMNQVMESYILHHARKFAPRFDANAYLRILNMWQRFDVATQHNEPDLVRLFAQRCRDQRWLLFSIDSDVCFEPAEQLAQAQVLKEAGVAVRYLVVHSDKGHDSFLLDPDLYAPQVRAILDEV